MLDHLKEKAEDINKCTSGLKKEKEKIAKQLSELSVALNYSSYDVYFDELGITRLFVDEAHNYKNVPIATKLDNVLGIRSGGSKKCADMMSKVRLVQKNGGGVVMATGTPVASMY